MPGGVRFVVVPHSHLAELQVRAALGDLVVLGLLCAECDALRSSG